MKTISDSLFVYFQNNIIINEIEGAFQIQYYINVDNINLNIINAMIDKKILPRPNSVRMSVVKQKIFFAFLSDTHLTYASNEAGFADETNEGGIFMSNEDVLL